MSEPELISTKIPRLERALHLADVMAAMAEELCGRATKRGANPTEMTIRKDHLRKALEEYRKARYGWNQS